MLSDCEISKKCIENKKKIFFYNEPNLCHIKKAILNLTNENCPNNLRNIKDLSKSYLKKVEEYVKLYKLNSNYKIIMTILSILINILLVIIIIKIF
jgi:hypothetical protein